MVWRPRSLTSFPAHFNRILVEAAAYAPRSVLFGSYESEAQASSVADNFRHFRWCLRQQPGILPKLSEIENYYQLRLSREEIYDLTKRWIVLHLTATPNRVGEIQTLNPHLAETIAEIE